MVHLLQLQCRVQILLFIFVSILLLLTSSMEVAFSDARRLPPLRLLPEDTGGGTHKAAVTAAADNKQEATAAGIVRGEQTTAEGRRARRRDLIGSRPPRCERVCMSCGHCEAVQVPIVPLPQQQKEKEMETAKASSRSGATAKVVTQLTAAMFTYRVDGIANYKPLSWKCSCGGIILDP